MEKATMARQVTNRIVSAFRKGVAAKCGNTYTDGRRVYLHGNLIAERRDDGSCWVTDANWATRTTHERLRALGLSVGFRKGVQVVYGRGEGALKHGDPWDGSWMRTSFVFAENVSSNVE